MASRLGRVRLPSVPNMTAIERGFRPRRPAVTAAGSDPTSTGRSLPMALNSITLILGKMVTMALGFVVWLVAAKLFAPAEVGLASGTVSAMMLCVQLALFGAGAAVISLYPQHLQRPGELLDTAIT